MTELWDAARDALPRAARRPARPARLRDRRAAGARRSGLRAGDPARPRPARPGLRGGARARARHRSARPRPRQLPLADAAQIEEGRSWVWLEDGVDPLQGGGLRLDAAAVQIQQVWVDPEARGRGYAARGAPRPLPAPARDDADRHASSSAARTRRRSRSTRRSACARRSSTAAPVLSPRACFNRLPGTARADRVERIVRRHDLIAPGGEVLVPRLRRRRLDLPLPRARASSATASRRCTSTTGCAAPNPTRTRLVRRACSARRSSRLPPAARVEAELRDVRYSFTRASCARPGTRSRTRSRRSSTGSPRAARRRGSRCDATTASSGRSSALARGDGGVLPRTRARMAHRLLEPRDDARPDPPPTSCRSSSGSTRPRARTSCASLDERRTMPPGSPSCSARLPARSGSISAAGCRSCASTTGSGSSRAREISTARSNGAPGGSSRACQGLKYGAGGRATGSSAARRRFKMCSSMQRSRAPIAKAGRSSCAATRSSRSRGSSRPRG